VEERLIM
jgi:chromosome segregation ATPase